MKNRHNKKAQQRLESNVLAEGDTKPKKKKVLVVGFGHKAQAVTTHLDWQKYLVREVGVKDLDEAEKEKYDVVVLYSGDISDKVVSAVHKTQSRHGGLTVAVRDNNEPRLGWKDHGLAFTSMRTVGVHLSQTLR